MSISSVQDRQAQKEFRRLERLIAAVENRIDPFFKAGSKTNIITESDLVAFGPIAPPTSGGELFWVKNDVEPHKIYAKLTSGSSVPEWVLLQRGTGGAIP